MKYRDLGLEAKQRACATSKLRYARRRDERRRENYLRVLPRLKTLYLSGCPFARTADYRASVLGLAPSTLVQLDADSLR